MWRCRYACELPTLCTPIALNHMPIPSVSMTRLYCNVFACVTDLKLTTRFTFLFSFSIHVSSNDTKSLCLSKPQLQWWIQIWESKYATEHNENKSSLPRIRVIKCDIWGSKGDDYKTVVTLYATPCSLAHIYQSFRENCVLHLQQASREWKLHMEQEQGLRNGQWERDRVSHSPARSPGSPPSLYEYQCFTVWILFYHEKGGNEFLRNANIYLPNYTSHPPRQYFSRVKKWYPRNRHILCQIVSL